MNLLRTIAAVSAATVALLFAGDKANAVVVTVPSQNGGGTTPHDAIGNNAPHVWNLTEPAGSSSFADTGTAGTLFAMTNVIANATTAGRAAIFTTGLDPSQAFNSAAAAHGGCLSATTSTNYKPNPPITLSAWFMPYQVNAGVCVVVGRPSDATANGDQTFSIIWSSTNFIIKARTTAGFVSLAGPSGFPQSTQTVWHNAVATYDQVNFKLYVDGSIVGTSANVNGFFWTNSNPWIIGGDAIIGSTTCDAGGGEVGCPGVVAKVIIDDTQAWTAAQIRTYYQQAVNQTP